MEWVTPELIDLNSRDALRRRVAYGICATGSGDWGCCDTGNSAGSGFDTLGNSDQSYCKTGNNGA